MADWGGTFWVFLKHLQHNINNNIALQAFTNTTTSIYCPDFPSIYNRYTTICLKTLDIDGHRYIAIYIVILWSLPFRGQLITDTYTRKFVHMLIIPFPVCVYAAINYKKKMTSRLPFCNKLRHTYKQEMELLTCGPASWYMCQLLTDLQRVRTTLPFELVLLVNFLISLKI